MFAVVGDVGWKLSIGRGESEGLESVRQRQLEGVEEEESVRGFGGGVWCFAGTR